MHKIQLKHATTVFLLNPLRDNIVTPVDNTTITIDAIIGLIPLIIKGINKNITHTIVTPKENIDFIPFNPPINITISININTKV